MSAPQGDLAGKWVVVTGANTGIGRVTAEKLAVRGATVTLACRSEERTKPVIDTIAAAGGSAKFAALDLGDLASVRGCANALLAEGRPIDLLINNAGLAGQRGLTKDGFELTFGTNHVGHFLFTVMLAPQILAAKKPRIVNVASKAHYGCKAIDYALVRQSTQSTAGLPEYAVSKVANVLFTKELARRLGPKGVQSFSLHPGVVASDVWREVPWPIRPLIKAFMITNEQGAETSLYCATSPDLAGKNGGYYDKSREKTPSKLALDEGEARKLWEKSVEFVGADLA